MKAATKGTPLKVQFTIVGQVPSDATHDRWAHLTAVPQVGDIVDIPGISQAYTVVRTVVWYLFPDDNRENPLDEPFAYVVLGSPRREEHGLQSMHTTPETLSGAGDAIGEP